MSVEIAMTAGALVAGFPWLRRRLQLSRAKHPSLAGHSRMAKRIARLLPGYSYGEDEFFGVMVEVAFMERRRVHGVEELTDIAEAQFDQAGDGGGFGHKGRALPKASRKCSMRRAWLTVGRVLNPALAISWPWLWL